jgi:uncharacterized protein with GYD domain
MAKYLIHANYSPEGARGLLREGGSSRREAVTKLAQSVGGSLESFYYAFGDTDAFVVIDAPSPEAAASLALTVSGSGGASVTTTVLLTCEQMDAARDLTPDYRAPGT